METNEIRRVVEQYSELLLHIALTRTDCAADAEDVVQDAFLKLMTRSPRFRDGGHEKAWLIRTTLNLAHDLRRSVSRRNLPLEEAASAEAGAAVRSRAVRTMAQVKRRCFIVFLLCM